MWTRNSEAFDFESVVWDTIISYMNDDIRELVHLEIAPCTKERFLNTYMKKDPDFEDFLREEFGIERR